MVNDIIADSLTRIRNASMRRLDTTTLYYAKIVVSILEVFQAKGFIEGYKVIEQNKKQSINVVLKYDEKGNRVIDGLRRISKPGLRIYASKDELPKVLNGLGIALISTSKGIMTDKKAREQGIGGEVLAYVW